MASKEMAPPGAPARRLRTALVTLALTGLALVGLPGPHASAATHGFDAVPSSLGEIPDSLDPDCGVNSVGQGRDVYFDVSGVPADTPITDVSLTMTLTHSFVGDLHALLVAPGGTASRLVFQRPGLESGGRYGHPSDLNGQYTFTDSAPPSPTFWQATGSTGVDQTVPPGAYHASDQFGHSIPLSSGWPGDKNGRWILSISDHCAGESGSISAARISITTAQIGTALTAHPAVLQLNPFRLTLALTATLTDPAGTAMAGQPVRFTVPGQPDCTAVTDDSGLATCTTNPSLWLIALLQGGYDASFDGTATHSPSTSHGPILR